MASRNTDLMLRVREGDDSAFDRLLTANHGAVLGIIHRYMGRRIEEADDLAQEVFLKVYRSRHRYLPTARFTTWLYRITANLCLNYRRDRSRHRMPSLDQLQSEPDGRRIGVEDPNAVRPEEGLARADVQRHVREALDELPDNQKMALVLARFEELSYREIAEILDTSEKAVKSLLHRARTSLKERLEHRLKGNLP